MRAHGNGHTRKGIRKVFGSRFLDGNSVKLLKSGTVALASILKAVEQARQSICLQFYIYRNDEAGRVLSDALMKKAVEGVPVYILYDHLGSILTPRSLWKELRSADIHVAVTHPFRWNALRSYEHRDHRKLLIVDSRLAFTGGLNIANEYIGPRQDHWRDTGVIIEGPAARELYEHFRHAWDTWFKAYRHIPPPPEPTEPTKDDTISGNLPVLPIVTQSGRIRRRMRNLFQHSIRNSRDEILLTTAYFFPGRRIVHALVNAAQRGVRVQLLMPARSDVTIAHYAGRHFFARLLKAGVEIHEYRGRMLHAKTYVFDSQWSIVGSANLDHRSFRLNDEGNVGILDKGFGASMKDMFHEDLKSSTSLEYNEWLKRPLWEKAMELICSRLRARL